MAARRRGQRLCIRSGEQQQRWRQGTLRRQAQFVRRSKLQQRFPADDIALAVRDLQTEMRQLAVMLDDAAQQARRHQQGGRVGGLKKLT